jgi:hypothetical protein
VFILGLFQIPDMYDVDFLLLFYQHVPPKNIMLMGNFNASKRKPHKIKAKLQGVGSSNSEGLQFGSIHRQV